MRALDCAGRSTPLKREPACPQLRLRPPKLHRALRPRSRCRASWRTDLLALARAGGADFAEVYAERTLHASFALDERRLKRSSMAVQQGVGVRAIRGEQTGYAYADGFAPDDLREAARVAARIARDGDAPAAAPAAFRVVDAPAPFTLASAGARWRSTRRAKVALLRRADDAARAHDPRVHEVSVALADSTKRFLVANSDGLWAEDRSSCRASRCRALALDGRPAPAGLRGRAAAASRPDYFDDTSARPRPSPTEAAGSAVTLLVGARARSRLLSRRGRARLGRRDGARVLRAQHGGRHASARSTSIRATQKGQQVAARGVTIVD